MWEELAETIDRSSSCPTRADDVVETRVESKREPTKLVLHSPKHGTYLSLVERDEFIWRLLDGSRTLADVADEYLSKYKSLGVDRIARLVEHLRDGGLLAGPRGTLFGHLADSLERGSSAWRLRRIRRSAAGFAVPLPGASRLLSFIGGLACNPATGILVLLFAAFPILLGAYFFVVDFLRFSFPWEGEGFKVGLAMFSALLLANLAFSFVNEMAKALMTLRLGRHVRGFSLYFTLGVPGFSTEADGLALDPVEKRVAVPLAGLIGQLALLGLCYVGAYGTHNLLWATASVLGAVRVFVAFCPFADLEVYRAAADWFGMPNLRRVGLTFARSRLWRAFRSGDAFSSQERVLIGFLIFVLVWTVHGFRLCSDALNSGVASGMTHYVASPDTLLLGRMIVMIAIVALAIPPVAFLAVSAAMIAFGAGRVALRSRIWDDMYNRAYGLIGLAVIAAYVGWALSSTTAGLWIRGVVIAVVGLGGAWMAFRAMAACGGGRLSRRLALIIAPPVACSVLIVGRAFPSSLPSAVLWCFAYALLGLFAWEWLKATRDFRALPGVENRALKTVIMCAPVWGLLWLRSAVVHGGVGLDLVVSAVLLLIAIGLLALLAPLHAGNRDGRFGPPLLLLFLAASALVGVFVLDLDIGAAGSLGFERDAPKATALVRLAESIGLLSLSLLSGALCLFFWAASGGHVPELAYDRPAEVDTDRDKLNCAMEFIFRSLLTAFREEHGAETHARLVDHFNEPSTDLEWDVRVLDTDLVQGMDEADISALANGLRASLRLLSDSVADFAGRSFVDRALTAAYDRLPWEDREVASEHVFGGRDWAGVIGAAVAITREEASDILRQVSLFEALDDAQVKSLCSRLRVEHFDAGDIIIRQGDEGDKFYVMQRGTAQVSTVSGGAEDIVAYLGAGDYFGEHALLTESARAATVRAVSDVDALVLSREHFHESAVAAGVDIEAVSQTIDDVRALHQISLFAEFSEAQLAVILPRFALRDYEEGEAIVQEGEIGDHFFAIRRGEVEVTKAQPDGTPQHVALLGSGEYFGEIALLKDVPRTATVTAVGACQMWALDKAAFLQMLTQSAGAAESLALTSSRRAKDLEKE